MRRGSPPLETLRSGGLSLWLGVRLEAYFAFCVGVFLWLVLHWQTAIRPHNTSDKTYIYTFVCTGVCPSACQCFVLYNVRSYVCVRLILNNS